jgi:hypothetical protein
MIFAGTDFKPVGLTGSRTTISLENLNGEVFQSLAESIVDRENPRSSLRKEWEIMS